MLGRRVDPEHDRVMLDGVPVVVDDNVVHWLLNKPAGRVTTASDPQGRPTVMGLVPDEPRVFPVGRLDLDSEGLLILTNDGDLAQLLTHPSHGVEKEYFVEVEGTPTPAELRTLRSGIELDDGRTRPARVRILQESATGTAALTIVVKEGRKRMVRRMFAAVGHPVLRLARHAYRTAARSAARSGGVAGAGAGRGAGAVRRRTRGARGGVRLTWQPVRLLALRGATTFAEDTKAEVDGQDAGARARDARAQLDLARRPRQHHLHRHRRPHRGVPGDGRPRARARRRAAAVRP